MNIEGDALLIRHILFVKIENLCYHKDRKQIMEGMIRY